MKNIENNFFEEIKKGYVIVDFFAEWCGPCKMFKPIFEESEKEFKNIKFCKFNVDQDTKNICDKLDIMSIPTLILFKDGKEIKRNIGFINKEELENFIGDINV